MLPVTLLDCPCRPPARSSSARTCSSTSASWTWPDASSALIRRPRRSMRRWTSSSSGPRPLMASTSSWRRGAWRPSRPCGASQRFQIRDRTRHGHGARVGGRSRWAAPQRIVEDQGEAFTERRQGIAQEQPARHKDRVASRSNDFVVQTPSRGESQGSASTLRTRRCSFSTCRQPDHSPPHCPHTIPLGGALPSPDA